MTTLEVWNFAQVRHALIEFGDLTILVGPQATGKSLLLQWLKVALDIGEIVHSLKEAGHDISTAKNLLELTFGEGMSEAWIEGRTKVQFDGRSVAPNSWLKAKRKDAGNVFYIPAHRALLLSEGWPSPFLRLNADTPVVARLFSQNLYQRFSGRKAAALFPVQRILKEQYRKLIDRAVFHGGRVQLENDGLRYQLRLSFTGGMSLPFMTWTAGQREFTPLLLGLYHLLPPRKLKKRPEIDWVVIEEPEMGLHPQAVSVSMLLILDLLWRGYKVVVSTHSPLVLDAVWAIQRLSELGSKWQLLRGAFTDEQSPALANVMKNAMRCKYKTYYMNEDTTGGGCVETKDISGLDPESPDEHEAFWGGLTGFSSNFGRAVRTAANEADFS